MENGMEELELGEANYLEQGNKKQKINHTATTNYASYYYQKVIETTMDENIDISNNTMAELSNNQVELQQYNSLFLPAAQQPSVNTITTINNDKYPYDLLQNTQVVLNNYIYDEEVSTNNTDPIIQQQQSQYMVYSDPNYVTDNSNSDNSNTQYFIYSQNNDLQCNNCNISYLTTEELLAHCNSCIQPNYYPINYVNYPSSNNYEQDNLPLTLNNMVETVVKYNDSAINLENQGLLPLNNLTELTNLDEKNQVQNEGVIKLIKKDIITSVSTYSNPRMIEITDTDEISKLCSICGEEFTNNNKLEIAIHMNTHKFSIENLVLKCKKCNKTFQDFVDFIYHVKEHASIPCLYCNVWFKNGVKVRQHIEKYHDTCVLCNIKFKKGLSLEKHEIDHVGYKIYQYFCTLCPAKFKCNKILYIHMAKYHPDFQTKAYLVEELKKYLVWGNWQDEKIGQCAYCWRHFNVNNLIRHLMLEHNVYRCGWCTSYMVAKNNDTIKCSFCGKINHVILKGPDQLCPVKSPENLLVYECYLCTTFINSFKKYKKHIKECEEKMSYLVDESGIKRPVHKDLVSKCCLSVLDSDNDLAIEHAKAHKLLDFYLPCFYCDEMLHRRNLISHLKTKHYYCGTCSLCYISTDLLTLHERHHFSDRRDIYECPYCKLCTENTDIFQSHLNDKHLVGGIVKNISDFVKKVMTAPLDSINDSNLLICKPYRVQCPYCFKLFPLIEFHYFINHVRNFHNIYYCQLCKVFSKSIDCNCNNESQPKECFNLPTISFLSHDEQKVILPIY